MLYLLVSACALLLLDQWSKRAVQVRAGRLVACGPFQIRYVTHLKRIFERRNARAALVLVWLVSLASAVILYSSGAWFQSPAALIGLGMAFGGAAGNLLDVLQYRYVVDFIDLGWWPVFNLADVGIVGGLSLAFLL